MSRPPWTCGRELVCGPSLGGYRSPTENSRPRRFTAVDSRATHFRAPRMVASFRHAYAEGLLTIAEGVDPGEDEHMVKPLYAPE
ncbi:MAG TPA: hypothetical protein DC059_03115 [Dietzia sp.]|nr:hypothetical protein [Dietzia sp.]